MSLLLLLQSAVTAPTAPVTAPTVAVGTEAVTVTTPVVLQGGATSYNIYRDGTQIATGRASNSGFSDTGASTVASQTYTVRGVNGAGESTDSPASSGIVADPGPPSFALVSGSALNTVNITRRPYAGVYKVYRRITPSAGAISAPWVGTPVIGNAAGANAFNANVDVSGATNGEVACIGGLLEDTELGPVSITAGWNIAVEGSEGASGGAGSHSFLAWKVKNSGDTTVNISWDITGKYQLIPFSYPGLYTPAPFELATYNPSTASSTVTTSSITPTAANRWILGLFGKRGTTAAMAFTPDAALTERTDVSTTASRYIALELADSNGTVTQAAHSYVATVTGSTASHGGSIIAALVPGPTFTLVHTSSSQVANGTYSWDDTGLTGGTSYDYYVTTTAETPTSRESAASAVQAQTPAAAGAAEFAAWGIPL